VVLLDKGGEIYRKALREEVRKDMGGERNGGENFAHKKRGGGGGGGDCWEGGDGGGESLGGGGGERAGGGGGGGGCLKVEAACGAEHPRGESEHSRKTSGEPSPERTLHPGPVCSIWGLLGFS